MVLERCRRKRSIKKTQRSDGKEGMELGKIAGST